MFRKKKQKKRKNIKTFQDHWSLEDKKQVVSETFIEGWDEGEKQGLIMGLIFGFGVGAFLTMIIYSIGGG